MLWTRPRSRITGQPAIFAVAVPLTLAFALVVGGCGGGHDGGGGGGGAGGDRAADSTATGGDVPRSDATGACQAFVRAGDDLEVPHNAEEWLGADRINGGQGLAVAAQRRDARYGPLADAATQAFKKVTYLDEKGIVAAVRSVRTACANLKLATTPGSGAAPTADARTGCAALARTGDRVHATLPDGPSLETAARIGGATELLKAAGAAHTSYRDLTSAGQHVIDDLQELALPRLPTDSAAVLSACAKHGLPH